MFFIKNYENLQHKVCMFCAETVKENVQLFLKNVRLLLKDTNERLLLKENVQLLLSIFYVEDCVAASRNISMFFNELVAASKRKKCAAAS